MIYALEPNLVTDPTILAAVQSRITEQLRTVAVPLQLSEQQLRLRLIDKEAGLFCFQVSAASLLPYANAAYKPLLGKAIEAVFTAPVKVEILPPEAEPPAAEAQLVQDTPAEAAVLPPAGDLPAEFPAAGTGAGEQVDRQAPDPGGPESIPSGSAPKLTLQFQSVEHNLRAVFTQPNRVVVVPGYLSRWLPYLGPLRLSLLVALFQAYYQSQRCSARPAVIFEASAPLLAALAGSGISSVWRHIDDPELHWFIEKAPYGPGESEWVFDPQSGTTRRKPARFKFHATTPLTPVDAEALHAFLIAAGLQADPLAVLTRLVRGERRLEPRDVFAYPAPPPPPGWQQRSPRGHSVQEVVFKALAGGPGAYTRALAELADELAARLLPAKDQIHLSWYFLLHWQSLLGHGPSWMITLLRDRCYYNAKTGELRDTEHVAEGYAELARALGLERTKTVREWFPAPNPGKSAPLAHDLLALPAPDSLTAGKRQHIRSYAAQFVVIVDSERDGRGQVFSFKAQVAMLDPLTPVHAALYRAIFPLVQTFQALDPERQQIFLGAFDTITSPGLGANERIDPADLGAKDTVASTDPGAIGTIARTKPGADEPVTPGETGAPEAITSTDLGADDTITAVDLDAFGTITPADLGAFETWSREIWAHLTRLNHLFLNHSFALSLRNFFEHLNAETPSTTTTLPNSQANHGEVEVGKMPNYWNAARLLENRTSSGVLRELLQKGVTPAGILSCYLYLASPKGEKLGLGYVIDRLRARPAEGQGGVYLRLAQLPPAEVLTLIRRSLNDQPVQSRDWRLAMGQPRRAKLLELLDLLGVDPQGFTLAGE